MSESAHNTFSLLSIRLFFRGATLADNYRYSFLLYNLAARETLDFITRSLCRLLCPSYGKTFLFRGNLGNCGSFRQNRKGLLHCSGVATMKSNRNRRLSDIFVIAV